MLSSNISSTCPHNMVKFGLLVAEIVSLVWAPHLISTGFASWLRYCSDVAERRSTRLCMMFGRPLGWYTMYTFSGGLAPDGILPGVIFTLGPSLAFITARHSSSGRQPNFTAMYKEWHYRTSVDSATYIRQGGHHVGHRPTF